MKSRKNVDQFAGSNLLRPRFRFLKVVFPVDARYWSLEFRQRVCEIGMHMPLADQKERESVWNRESQSGVNLTLLRKSERTTRTRTSRGRAWRRRVRTSSWDRWIWNVHQCTNCVGLRTMHHWANNYTKREKWSCKFNRANLEIARCTSEVPRPFLLPVSRARDMSRRLFILRNR